MADLETFRKKIRRYYRARYHEDGKTKYTLHDLADLIPMNEDELGKRLNGYRDEKTGRAWQLTEENVLDIVLRLAELQALNWEQAVELLTLMDYPVKTNPLSWQTKLREHLAPPNLVPSSTSQTIRTANGLDASQGNQLGPRPRLFHPLNRPEGYVPRPDIFQEIKRRVLEEGSGQTIGITTALRGAGGFGKTTLATALCHDAEIQAAFPDILWIELGEQPPQALDLLNRLLTLYEESSSEAITLQEAQERWHLALRDRVCLLVIDDVWQQEALSPLLQGGARCRHLVTTRNDVLLPKHAARVVVDAMTLPEAVQVLCQDEALPADLAHPGYRSQLEALADRLGCWPLLLTLARGMLTDLVVESHSNIAEALTTLAEAYETFGVTAFRLDNMEERQRTVDACLRVSIQHLETFTHAHYHATERYQELAVFPEDTDIPLATLQIYWKGSGGLQPWATKDLCIRLHRLSLLLTCDLSTGTIRLHDVLRSYLIQRAGSHLPVLHARLLDTSRQAWNLTRWSDLPAKDHYLWHHLVLHLCMASRWEERYDTLTDLDYLIRKILYIGTSALEVDLLWTSTAAPDDPSETTPALFASLHRTIERVSHLLRQVQTPAELGGLLLSYLGATHPFAVRRYVLEEMLPHPVLTAWYPLPGSAALRRTLTGHTHQVQGCAVSPDGCFIVSTSCDRTLKVWDSVTGTERFTLTGHTNEVSGCAVSPDSRFIVSASRDGTLKVWDSSTGAERLTLKGHTNVVYYGCAVSSDGRFIVSASGDKTLKVWDAATRIEHLTLQGHTDRVNGCAVSPDGRFIVSASRDGTLKVWDSSTGAERLTLKGHIGWVNSCAVSPDGRFIVSASEDRTLKIWDAATGAERLTLSGHTHMVNGCAMSPNGRFIISVSNDHTLKAWDAASGACLLTFPVDGPLYGCAFHPDGVHLVACGTRGMFFLRLVV